MGVSERLGAASMGSAEGGCGVCIGWAQQSDVSAGCSLVCVGGCQCTQGATA